MNNGVKLLLQRMDSHPEEFEDRFDPYRETEGKWDPIIRQIFHRVEIIDRDRGFADKNEKLVGISSRQTKPLGYLTDDEVLTLLAKLNEVQAAMFERKVMRTLLTDERSKQEYNEDVYSPVAVMTAPYLAAKGSL